MLEQELVFKRSKQVSTLQAFTPRKPLISPKPIKPQVIGVQPGKAQLGKISPSQCCCIPKAQTRVIGLSWKKSNSHVVSLIHTKI